MALRDHPWVVVLVLLAVVYGVYEPAARAAYLPFIADSRVLLGFSAISYPAIWLLMLRNRRQKYWPNMLSRSKGKTILHIASAALVIPVLISYWATSLSSWVTYYFGMHTVASKLVVDEVDDIRKFRRLFVKLSGRDVVTGKEVEFEWAVAENPSLTRPDRSWLGKMCCINGVSAWPGILVQRIELCPSIRNN